jgi:dTMP kinase
LRPDLTLYLDVPVETGLARAGRRSDPDRFEKEQSSFFDQVRAAYLGIAREQPGRVEVVDAGQTLEGVRAQLAAHLDAFLLLNS